MKRFLVLLLTVSLLLIMFTESGSAESEFIGTWQLVKVTHNNSDYAPDSINMSGLLGVTSNGKAAIILNNQAVSFAWTLSGEGNLILMDENNATIVCEMKNNDLLFDINGYGLTFEKKSGGKLPDSIKAYDNNAFEGKWILSRLNTNDGILDVAFLPFLNTDIQLTIEINRSIASIGLIYQGLNAQWNSNTTFSEGILLLDKDNGILGKEIKLLNSGELKVTIGDAILLLAKEGENLAGWKCSTCGHNASGKFCSNCGTAYSASNGISSSVRNTGTTQISRTLSTGTFKIGEDIPAGTYTITCIEVEDSLDETMDALVGLAGLLDEDLGKAYSAYFGLLGSLAGEPKVTVRVVDSAGYTVKSSELKQGESVILQLKSGATLHISDGKCSLQSQ